MLTVSNPVWPMTHYVHMCMQNQKTVHEYPRFLSDISKGIQIFLIDFVMRASASSSLRNVFHPIHQ